MKTPIFDPIQSGPRQIHRLQSKFLTVLIEQAIREIIGSVICQNQASQFNFKPPLQNQVPSAV
jgi:hypothetical protein